MKPGSIFKAIRLIRFVFRDPVFHRHSIRIRSRPSTQSPSTIVMAQKKKKKKKGGKGTPTWPTVKKRSQVLEKREPPFPPLALAGTDLARDGQENVVQGGGKGCWTSTSSSRRLFQPLSNNNTTDGSRSSRSCSRSCSRGGSTTTPSKVSSLITQEGGAGVTSTNCNSVVTNNVVKEMAGLLLGGGCSASDPNDDRDDDDSDSVRPQILFGDLLNGNGGGAGATAAAAGGGGGEDADITEPDEDGVGRLITSPWDLPAPFMLSATGLLATSGAAGGTASATIDSGSSGDASTILRKQQPPPPPQQQQQQMGEGASSSSFFSFSTNSPARRIPLASRSTGSSNSSNRHCRDGGDDGHVDGFGMMMTTPIPNQHNVLQHQAHQPLPPEQFRNHQYHLTINNGCGSGGDAYGYGVPHHPAPPGPAFSSSITSGSASIGGGSGPMNFSSSGAPCYGGGGGGGGGGAPPPLSGPLYQNGIGGGGGSGVGGVWGTAGWAPDTFDIGGLRYPLRNVPLLYSPYDVFQSGQHPPHWQNFQRRHTQY